MKFRNLFLLLWLLTISFAAHAQFTYVTNNGTLTITGYNCPITNVAVSIPSKINGLPVTVIKDHAFAACTNVKILSIPDSVSRLEPFAFYNCTGLTNVTIGKSVTSIGGYSFYGCTGLVNVAIPVSVNSVGPSAFRGCSRLSAIIVEDQNAAYCSVEGVLFSKTGGMLVQYPGGKTGSYTIPSTVNSIAVTSIGYNAFSLCAGLTGITIPGSVTSLWSGAFSNCGSLTNVAMATGVTKLDSFAFYGCGNLVNLEIPNSVSEIGPSAFADCGALKTLVIGSGVTNLGDSVFYGCVSLAEVYFSSNAPSFGASVFLDSDNVVVYYLPGTTGWGATFADRPTALWLPTVQGRDCGFGLKSHQFGFNINWAPDKTVVVEATTNSMNPIWTPVSTNVLTGGTSYFNDPQWTNYPSRLYRLRGQ